MTGSTISTTIAHTVTLGYGGYPSPLKITTHGAVDPSGVGNSTAAISGYGTVINYGTILASKYATGVDVGGYHSRIVNHGVIIGQGGAGHQYYFGPPSAVFINYGATLQNFGTISGGHDIAGYGVKLRGAEAINHGLITGETGGNGNGVGVEIYEGGTLVNDGTISGGMTNDTLGFAVLVEDGGTVVVDPGAVFIGVVTAYSGELKLQGTSATKLSGIGTSFVGFNTISFAPGAAWTIEGTATSYNLDVIDGFTSTDTIILDGFAATSDTFVSGTGLILSNGTTSETLHINGSFTGHTFVATATSGTTIIDLATISQNSNQTISTTLTSPVQLGINYPTHVTITALGAVNLTASDAPAVSGAGDITNYGVILGGGDASITGIGVSLSSGTIDNVGSITGGPGTYSGVGVVLADGTLLNSGTITGSVSLTKSHLANSGKIGTGGVTLTNSTMTNSGRVGSETATASYLDNTGTIKAGFGSIGVALIGSTLVNSGSLIHTGTLGSFGGTALSLVNNGTTVSKATNSGIIHADTYGDTKSGIAVRDSGGTFTNDAGGRISGLLGVDLAQGVFTNNGIITGNTGVYFSGGTLINAGTINGVGGVAAPSLYQFGAGDAVLLGYYSKAPSSTLVVDPGAVFNGNVVAYKYKNDVLEFSGSSTAALSGIGTQFDGFRDISFAAGAAWTIAGDTAGLAAHDTIAGFTTADAIILDNFAATSETYVAGKGLELANATATATLDITGSFSTASFMVVDQSGNSVITLVNSAAKANAIDGPAGDTITGTVTVGITLGSGGYDSPLTITNTGEVAPAQGNAVYAATGMVFNDGTILAGTGTTSDGTGGVGVSLTAGALTNSGTITGGAGGVGGYGLYLEGGTAANSGTIIGGAGSATTYSKTGYLAASGVFQKVGVFDNTGTIIGGVSDTTLAPGASGAGLVIGGGSADNQGLIEGGKGDNNRYQTVGSGVDITGGEFTNEGRIKGGASTYAGGVGVSITGGMGINLAGGTITGGVGKQYGGFALVITGDGTFENFGFMTGKAGSIPAEYYSDDCGARVLAGSLMNAGTIASGLGMYYSRYTSGGIVSNTGIIIGGGIVVQAGTLINLAGGLLGGLNLQGGLVENAGTITPYAGSDGGAFINIGSLFNTGSIIGASVDGYGVLMRGGYLNNSGVITAGEPKNSITGYGVEATAGGSATLVNTGTILGGSGGVYGYGGDGVILYGETGFNSGLIEGGFGRFGGDGVHFEGSSFTNAGTIEAGQGAIPGVAVSFDGGSTLIADPGAVFDGAVVAKAANTSAELDLGAGTSGAVGTLDMGGEFFRPRHHRLRYWRRLDPLRHQNRTGGRRKDHRFC